MDLQRRLGVFAREGIGSQSQVGTKSQVMIFLHSLEMGQSSRKGIQFHVGYWD